MRVPRIVISRYGGPEVFVFDEHELPAPGPGQVRVAVRAAGINFAEVFCRLGLYRAAPPPPFVPGFEVAGVVESVGEGVEEFTVGDRVFGVTRFGGYQGGIVADAERLQPMPEGWSFEEAAGFPAAAVTAGYGLLEPGNLRPGEIVVVHSAAGGVGSMAVQLAQAVGAEVIGTCGRDEKLEVLEELGCVLSINYRKEDWVARVRQRYPDGVHVVFDALGGRYYKQGFDLLRPRGRLIAYGMGSATPAGKRPNWPKLAWQILTLPRYSPFALVPQNKLIAGFNVLLLWDELDVMREVQQRCLEHARAGSLKVRVSQVAPYDQVGVLHEALQSGRTTGKLVLQFPESGS